MFTSNVQDDNNQEEEHDEIEEAWEQHGRHNESDSDGNYEEPMAPPTLSRLISRKPSGIPYTPSGLTTAINRTYPTGDIPPEDITSTLRWQADVNGEAAAIQGFRTEILSQQGLVVFAFIQTEDHYLSLLHSPALYAARGATGALKGKDIGFVGDRTDFAHPIPTLLKTVRPWKWNEVDITEDQLGLETFFSDKLNLDKWYITPPGVATSRHKVPRLLLLPPNLTPFCCKAPRTPYELLQHTTTLLEGEADPKTHSQYKLLALWCMAACHGTTPTGNSIMAYAVDAAHSQERVYHQWLRQRLEATLGPVPTTALVNPPSAQPSLPQQQDLSHLAAVAAEFGKGLVDAIRPVMGNQLAPAVGGTGPTDGKTYDAYNFAVLQGFSHCPTPAGLQPIWGLFTQTKSIETHRLHIKEHMKNWARTQGVTINKGIFFSKQTIEDIMHLRFNPSGGVAYFSTAEKGISILLCHPKAGDDRDHARADEMAQDISSSNRTLAEALILGKKDPRPPPDSYNDLKAALGTFCALLWTLFGEHGQYFAKCMELYTCMDSDNVSENGHLFKPLLCRQVLWAILDDGREYFSQTLLPNAFLTPPNGHVKYPRSSLEELIQPVKNQSQVFKGNFPHQWLNRNEQTARGARTGGGGSATTSFQSSIPPAITASSSASQRSTTSSITAATANTARRAACRATDIHPRLLTTLSEYITRIGSLQMTRVMSLAGVRWENMPTIPAYMANGTNKLCYNYVLGKCNPRYCTHRQGHAAQTEITDEFAEKICTLLQPGFAAMTPELARASYTDFKNTVDTRAAARAEATE